MHQRNRVWLAVAPGLAVLALPQAARAQDEDYRQIVTAMRACAAIADVAARVACYDAASLPPAGAVVAGAGSSAPPLAAAASPPPSAPRQAAVAPAAPTGFGSETLPATREARAAQQDEALEIAVSAVREVQPGIAELTLGDGAQWRLTDAASFSYDLPRRGDMVRLQRGALGSFYLHFKGQRALRIQRVR